MKSLSRSAAGLALALFSIVQITPGFAQSGLDKASEDAATEQAARAKSVTSKGKEIHYHIKWDLSDLPHYQPQVKAAGTIREWGANYFTDGLLAGFWEEDFHKYQPDVKFDYHLQTSEHAISALCFKVSDLSPLGRQIMWDERLAFQRAFDYQPTGVVIVTGSYDVSGWNPAIGIFVNKSNPVSRLTLKQLDGIYGCERAGLWNALTWDKSKARGPEGNIRTWGQLGLTGEWADKPIHILGYNLEFHFTEEITTRCFGGVTNKWNETLHEYDNELAPGGKLKLAGQLMIEEVSRDPYAIAYVAGGTTWLTPQSKALGLAAREGGPYYELTIENVRNRTYPMYADVFAFLNRDPRQPMDPKLREFLRYVLSREGQEQVVRDGKYLPLTGEAVRGELKKLD